MNVTKINWTDLTWNPVSGCTKLTAGCKYCYAETLAENKRGTRAFPVGFDLMLRPWKLDEPRRVKTPSLIFTNSMSDMFHADIPDEYRDRICDVMRSYPEHRFQVLTKRPEIAARYFSTRAVPESMWMGTTVEHAATKDRIDVLRSIDSRVRFLSLEPLIGHLGEVDLTGIHWVITGGESGNHMSDDRVRGLRGLVRRGDRKSGERLWMPREDRHHWITELRDQCRDAGAAFWHKQWGGPRPESGGRIVDGVEHNGMPDHIDGAMPEVTERLVPGPRQRRLPIASSAA
jgi:protein gp37